MALTQVEVNEVLCLMRHIGACKAHQQFELQNDAQISRPNLV